MEIINHEVTELKDPTGIMPDRRFEWLLDVEVEEEDELYTEKGLVLRVILAQGNDGMRIVQHFFLEKESEQVLDFAMDDEEEQQVLDYCRANLDTGV
ncbi:DUF6509 family protein [Indiicoccus explosivorum]|uniref:DUF6509 family protein n=1 Tax=Indiicoccus explosivorum TaxID=1917864 RepID=UPI000B445E9E|nr:DUF6509 family protein [Indiicoccus explosivorum]